MLRYHSASLFAMFVCLGLLLLITLHICTCYVMMPSALSLQILDALSYYCINFMCYADTECSINTACHELS